jgi:pyruvate-ferredoxin/flavodoxin oxidoreductase
MAQQEPIRAAETENWDVFQALPNFDRSKLDARRVKDVQLLEPLFEFSGACAGCGETPYLKLMSQLFGDRAVIANATGCSSIYGGNLPTTPWAKNADGRGPAWNNSLFEDNAEFGLGMRLSIDKQRAYAQELLKRLAPQVGDGLATAIIDAPETSEAEIAEQRARVATLKSKLGDLLGAGALNGSTSVVRDLLVLADLLVRRNVWIIGGDGWAYDIGYGGLDHVMASGRDVNILVLDTEVYSNTGGQASKATPRAAVAKFAAGGKASAKKDLALLAMTYGNVYVARVAMGANDAQTIRAFIEAESYAGPSLIIAYSHCIAHGFDLAHGMDQQKLAVASGYWPTMRFDPRRQAEGDNPLQLDSRAPSEPISKFAYNETRFSMLLHSKPEQAKALMAAGQEDVRFHWKLYEFLAAMHGEKAAATAAAQAAVKDGA